MRIALQTLVLLAVLLLAGCYETTFFLGKAEEATVDSSLMGKWTFDSLGPDANEKATLDVGKFDDHRYQLDWTTADGKVMKMAGHVTKVKGAMFVHAALLDADNKPGEKHFLIRVDRDGENSIVVSNLEPSFFANKTVDSDASLRAIIEAGLDDPNLYVGDVLIGKRGK